jgi:hypothetical protein
MQSSSSADRSRAATCTVASIATQPPGRFWKELEAENARQKVDRQADREGRRALEVAHQRPEEELARQTAADREEIARLTLQLTDE